MNEIKSYDSKFYEDLWLNQWADMERYNPTALHLKKHIVKIINTLNDVNTILDAGCGMGLNILDLRKNFPQKKLTGGELTEGILDLAKKFTGTDSKTTYFQLDLSSENLNTSRKYDLVLCNQVLEHIDNDELAIRNLSNLSNKYILITVPAGSYNKTSMLVGHFRHYSIQSLSNKISNNNLEIIYLKSWGFPFHSVYKFLLNTLSEENQKKVGMGSYGITKRVISYFLYQFFKLNIFNKGENIIMLCKKK